jgi:hypothetical protein
VIPPLEIWHARHRHRSIPTPAETTHRLATVPEGAIENGVTARSSIIDGCASLRVELTDEITAHGTPGVDYVDQPTFLRLATRFRTGTITVEILSRLNHKTTFDSRAFAGLAFHITDDPTTFASVYLRPLNGRRLQPPPPRDQRAVQYFAYPAHPFDRLREHFPDGRYEAGANITPSEWITLRVEISDELVTATIGDDRVLSVAPLALARTGDVGLFVDIGTEAFFRNLHIIAG